MNRTDIRKVIDGERHYQSDKWNATPITLANVVDILDAYAGDVNSDNRRKLCAICVCVLDHQGYVNVNNQWANRPISRAEAYEAIESWADSDEELDGTIADEVLLLSDISEDRAKLKSVTRLGGLIYREIEKDGTKDRSGYGREWVDKKPEPLGKIADVAALDTFKESLEKPEAKIVGNFHPNDIGEDETPYEMPDKVKLERFNSDI